MLGIGVNETVKSLAISSIVVFEDDFELILSDLEVGFGKSDKSIVSDRLRVLNLGSIDSEFLEFSTSPVDEEIR